jgi:acyl-CoA synthetase (AMP-forming)/AMP-acid ligase II
VRIVPGDTVDHGRRLLELLRAPDVTLMQATPATWQMLVDAGWTPGDTSARLRAWSGGEALPRPLADALLDRAREVWNLYGPTETTIWSTVARVTRSDKDVAIGRPLANTRTWVVDRSNALAPIGVPGELLIGGAGVARGYRNRPDLTAERFVELEGERAYRTGDSVRWSADGLLHYEGRLDSQVKVRGHRIELGEIEAVLATRDSVKAAAARVWDARIAAYVVFHEGREETPSDLRRFLRTYLPDYMIPSLFVSLPELPLTANRKVDRNRLPRPGAEAASRRAASERPAPGLEAGIAAIWAELLKTEAPIDAHDNFFELGGHSLLALRAAYRIEQLAGARLDPRAIFMDTLRELASRCARTA